MSGTALLAALDALVAALAVADPRLTRYDPTQPASSGWVLYDGPELWTQAPTTDGWVAVGIDADREGAAATATIRPGPTTPARPRDEDGTITLLVGAAHGADQPPATARTTAATLIDIIDQATRGTATSIAGATIRWGLIGRVDVAQAMEGQGPTVLATVEITYSARI